MQSLTCFKCNINFNVPDYWYQTRKEDHNSFWCPNGHEQIFAWGLSQAEKIRQERDLLKQRIAQKDDEIADNRRAKDKAERTLKRVQKRAAAGLCQCCNRTFSNMARHMKTKHPELACDAPKLKVIK